jgi:spermidine/putrescine ABC transporter ATP-binding subunit
MSRVRLEGVEKRYGATVAVENLDLEICEGEFLTLLGPSGCGKTTTLRMIAGFIEPTRGRLLIDDDDVTNVPPQKRSIGMVFQDYALFPHLTIGENIAFGLVERGISKDRIRARVTELLDLVRLPGAEGRYPSEISGGQQQRIALARAVAFPPRVLLMDEPLGALDLKLREAMQVELRRIQQELRITTVYVTHDQTEAMSMSDRIAVMNAGHIDQLDTPWRIYDSPATRFVASFVGKINFLDGQVRSADDGYLGLDTPFGILRAPLTGANGHTGAVTLAVRPEHLRFLADGERTDGLNVVCGTVESQVYIGNLRHVTVRLGAGHGLLVEVRPDERAAPVGASVAIGWRTEQAIVIRE